MVAGSGRETINWYNDPKYWPFILVFIGTWKGIGYNSIIYFSFSYGNRSDVLRGTMVDGTSKRQQIKHVTIPNWSL